MSDPRKLFELENRFWQAIVDVDVDEATAMLSEPAFMISPMGVLKFDHGGYRKMAKEGDSQVKSFELKDMEATFPADGVAIVSYTGHQVVTTKADGKDCVQDLNYTSTWVRDGDTWRCAMHTQSPRPDSDARH